MANSLVFISHITPEKEIAIEFKALIETHFLGMIDVFVSSDGETIQMGQKWLDSISGALKACAVEIVLCSPISVNRPWINFEAGAGWIRDIPVIPLCHSGMTPSDLPIPLNMLQAAKATDVAALKLVFPVLAAAIGAKTPAVDFSAFIEKVRDFERRYTFWTKVNEAFSSLNYLDQRILSALKNGLPFQLRLNEVQIATLAGRMQFLKENKILDFNRVGDAQMNPSGVFFGCRFVPMTEFAKVVGDANFHP
jgi:hypothetical protein